MKGILFKKINGFQRLHKKGLRKKLKSKIKMENFTIWSFDWNV